MSDQFIHTDAMGVPVKCTVCLEHIYHPAVKIAEDVEKTDNDGPYMSSWQVVYHFYHYECARKKLSEDRPWWKIW